MESLPMAPPSCSLDWKEASRQLTVAVGRAEHEPALEAIAFALGLAATDSAPLTD